jgi:hypothetical protein
VDFIAAHGSRRTGFDGERFYRLQDMDQCAIGPLWAVLHVGSLPRPAGFDGVCAKQGAVPRMHELQSRARRPGQPVGFQLRPVAAAFPTSSRMRREDR